MRVLPLEPTLECLRAEQWRKIAPESWVWILDGERTVIAHAGDFIFIPRETRHRFKNVGVHAAQPWDLERFATPEILRFNEESGVQILPE